MRRSHRRRRRVRSRPGAPRSRNPILSNAVPTNADNLRSFLVESFYDVEVFIDPMKRGEVELFDPEIVYEDSNLPDHIGEAYGADPRRDHRHGRSHRVRAHVALEGGTQTHRARG